MRTTTLGKERGKTEGDRIRGLEAALTLGDDKLRRPSDRLSQVLCAEGARCWVVRSLSVFLMEMSDFVRTNELDVPRGGVQCLAHE